MRVKPKNFHGRKRNQPPVSNKDVKPLWTEKKKATRPFTMENAVNGVFDTLRIDYGDTLERLAYMIKRDPKAGMKDFNRFFDQTAVQYLGEDVDLTRSEYTCNRESMADKDVLLSTIKLRSCLLYYMCMKII